MKQGHVGTPEIFAITCIYLTRLVYYSMPTALAEKAYTGAWLLHFLIGLSSIVLFIAVYLPLKRFPGKSLIQISGEVLGRPGELLVTLLLAGYFLYVMVNYTRVLADNVITTILPNTPLTFLIGFMLLAAVVGIYQGLESLTRTALIFGPFVLLGFLTLIGFSLHEADWTMLYPIPGASVKTFISGTVWLTPVIYDGIMYALLAPYFRKDKNLMKIFSWSAIVCTVIVTVLFIVMQAKIFYPAMKNNPLDVYQLVRLIHLGRFIQRVEALYVLEFVIAETIHLILVFYLGILALAQGLRLNDLRPLALPWAVLVFALALIPKNSRSLPQFYYSPTNSLIYYSVICGLPLMVYVVALIRKKRGGSGESVETNN